MSKDSNKRSYFDILISILLALVITKGFWVFIEYKYLPKNGVDKDKKADIKSLYYRYNLASKKEKPKVVISKPPTRNSFRPKESEIKKFILKGIIASDDGGIVTLEYRGKTYVLTKGETLKGYKLSEINPTNVVFTKMTAKYKLELFGKQNSSSSSYNRDKKVGKPNSRNSFNSQNKDQKDIIQEGDTVVISKNLFDRYKNDMRAITRNINALPVKSGNRLKGFRVTYIRKGSYFDQLGLKVGDTITAINGEDIVDLKVPMEFFSNINNVTDATITIKRGSELKELEYEIR